MADRLSRALKRARAAAGGSNGFTVVELLVTMGILLVVLTSISATFVSGTHAETNVRNRAQAESDARLALTKMRDDIHCAFDVQSVNANASGGYTLSLSEFFNQCQAVDTHTGSGSTVYLAWCTIPDAAHPGKFDLYRANTACDSSGTLMASDIVAPAAGWPSGQLGNIWPGSRTCMTGYLKTQAVDLAVNPDIHSTAASYELRDEIALRNSTRSVNCAGSGAAAQLVFVTQPGGAASDAPFMAQPQVAAEDGGGRIVRSYTGTVTLSIKSGTGTSGATLRGCTSTLLNGVTTFDGCTIDKVGTGYVLIASDGTYTADSDPFDVEADVATTLQVSGFASPTAAGVSHTFTVTAKDARGFTVTGYTGTIFFTSNDPAAVLPPNYTFTAADRGTHTFSATLKTSGTRVISATDFSNGSLAGSQTGIVVTGGSAARFLVGDYPSPTTAGVSHTFTVTAVDAFGNVAQGYTGTVHFTSSDAQSTAGSGLPTNYTFTAADNGTHTFNGTLKTVGTQSITATDTVAASINGSQTGITVTAGSAATLLVAGYPSPTTAGVSHTFTVTAKDAFGNTITGYTGTVHFTSTDGQAVLPADYTFVAGDNGTHSFDVTLKTAGPRSITATDTVTASITGSQTVTVTAAAATTLVVAGFPSPVAAGTAGSVAVTAKDAFGNTATGYTGRVHFTSTDPQATLPGDYTFVAGDNGVHTFTNGVTLKTVGTRSVTATDTGNGTITGTQGNITVTPGAATSLTVAGYPSPTTAGVSHTFTVTAKDAFGNVATGYTGTVRFTATNDAAAVLPANYQFVAGDAGTKSFSATFKTVAGGAKTLTATDTGTPGTNGSQTGIVVNAAAATAMVFVNCSKPNGNTTCADPISVGNQSGSTMTANIALVDQFGNTAVAPSNVTISLTSGSTANFTVTGSVQITAGSSQSGPLTITTAKKNAAATTITAHLTSGQGYPDITIQVTG